MNCADKKTGVRKRRLYNNKVKMYLQKKRMCVNIQKAQLYMQCLFNK